MEATQRRTTATHSAAAASLGYSAYGSGCDLNSQIEYTFMVLGVVTLLLVMLLLVLPLVIVIADISKALIEALPRVFKTLKDQ